MKTIKNMLKTEVTYDDEMKNKYLIRKEWDKSKKKALVIFLNGLPIITCELKNQLTKQNVCRRTFTPIGKRT